REFSVRSWPRRHALLIGRRRTPGDARVRGTLRAHDIPDRSTWPHHIAVGRPRAAFNPRQRHHSGMKLWWVVLLLGSLPGPAFAEAYYIDCSRAGGGS